METPVDESSTLDIALPYWAVERHQRDQGVGESGGRSQLVVVLMNPPSASSGRRTRNAVLVAGALLGYANVRMVNLCRLPTKSVVELADSSLNDWRRARPYLKQAIGNGSAILTAWGVSPLRGAAQQHFNSQVDWFCQEAQMKGMDRIWTVGGSPRHPSRWYQFVADKHGRTDGGTFPQRLNQVLEEISIYSLSRRGALKLPVEVRAANVDRAGLLTHKISSSIAERTK